MGEVKIVREISIVIGSDFDGAMAVAEMLRAEGYEIISGPEEIQFPYRKNSDKTPVTASAYEIVADDGKPEYVS